MWLGNQKIWDETRVRNNLSQVDADIVLRMYLPQHQVSDNWLWHYTADGSYTVKSGYWLATHLPEVPVTRPPGDPHLKHRIWQTTLSPKLKHFYWRVLSSALGSGSELARRGIPVNSTCQRCHLAQETTNHILFTCPYAVTLWTKANLFLPNTPFGADDIESNIRELLQHYASAPDEVSKQTPFWLGWSIWKSRNDMIFNKNNQDTDTVLAKTWHTVLEWVTATTAEPVHDQANDAPSTSRSHQWSPPPFGFIKCNYDGSFRYSSQAVGVGWIVHDSNHRYLTSGNSRLRTGSSPLESECLALLYSLQCLWSKGFRYVIMEGDCSTLNDLLHHKHHNLHLANILHDIRSWADRFTEVYFNVIPRGSNQAADSLAKLAHNQRALSISSCITSVLYNPTLLTVSDT